ncbi:hypothetical protein GW17_00009906 [Ensete ventricosum]|nr:hypothetical protein GW17_00009906 [Ensete ventricosum]
MDIARTGWYIPVHLLTGTQTADCPLPDGTIDGAVSTPLEFDLAMQSNDLKRALQCLLTMSNSRDVGQETTAADITEILSLTAVKQENLVDAVQGIAKFAKEFLDLIDAADATGQADIAREALKRLASAGSVKGALQGQVLKGLALRLANHGELTRLSVRKQSFLQSQ